MTNTHCPLNPVHDEAIHMNMQAGTWPVTVTGMNGRPVITNIRKCSCGRDRGRQVFYMD